MAGGLHVYNSDVSHPLSRCQSMSTWEERCVRYAEHTKMGNADHEDERGYTWVSAKPVDTTPHDALNDTERGVVAQLDKVIAQTEALRELLSYCRSEAERLKAAWEDKLAHGYGEVADRLSKILDGES